MFETVLKKLLARYLGQYVDVSGISAAKLKASVWSGEIVLQNLALKREALAWLELPVHICAGSIGLLQMSIPWASLGSQPCKVVLEDVQLLATDASVDGIGTGTKGKDGKDSDGSEKRSKSAVRSWRHGDIIAWSNERGAGRRSLSMTPLPPRATVHVVRTMHG